MTASDPAGRPRIDARVTSWLIEARARTRSLELDRARLEGELSASERIERAAQRYADKLEARLADARKREASLARALGYVEAQRDQLLARLEGRTPPPLPAEVPDLELVPEPPPAARARTAPRG